MYRNSHGAVGIGALQLGSPPIEENNVHKEQGCLIWCGFSESETVLSK